MPFGTLTVLDDIEADNTIVEDFGQEELAARFREALDLHNEQVEDMISDIVGFVAVPQVAYGVSESVELQELDEFGQADASKAFGGGNVGFPLRSYGSAVQWTRLFLQRNTIGTLAAQADAHAAADIRNVHRQFRRSIFRPTNLPYKDVNDTNWDLTLRALTNGDGMGIPISIDGDTFNPASHTHYTGTATLTETALAAHITNVTEHGVTGEVRVYINRAQEATIRAFPLFERFVGAGIQPGADDSFATGMALDYGNPNNRAIGMFEGAVIYVRPWIPAGYVWVFDTGTGGRDKVLGVRTRTGGFTGMGAFTIVAEYAQYPLQARQMAREFGVSVLQRHKGAVMYVGSGSYVAPTI